MRERVSQSFPLKSPRKCICVCMSVYECVWVCMGVYGCVWVCMGVYDLPNVSDMIV